MRIDSRKTKVQRCDRVGAATGSQTGGLVMRGSDLVTATGLALITAAAVLATLDVGPAGAMFLSGVFLGWSGLDLRKRWGRV